MNHRFGEASYALMYDFYLADHELWRFRESPAWGTLPEGEREVFHSLFIRRVADAREAIRLHPPWVITPDIALDGATCRIVDAIGRALRDMPGVVLPDREQVMDRVADFIEAEFRRVVFDRDSVDKHASAVARRMAEGSRRHRARMMYRAAVHEATLGAARAKLEGLGESPSGKDYLGQLARWRHFGVDVICRYEREKRMRGWLGWFYRWRGGGA